ncbi:hypothetical protein [Marinobacter sp. BGYM27]|uniref:hypothetical protein n=1 Tax=Marinobacter sp. BGYM27 TaxID=2975597 RepID=UPI0021A91D6C|nr:hypothetical protein [Marinobacter sp. BGYM27]MDG5498484.1 hypothetical protein [Marinobacter sp. BGYM27]
MSKRLRVDEQGFTTLITGLTSMDAAANCRIEKPWMATEQHTPSTMAPYIFYALLFTLNFPITGRRLEVIATESALQELRHQGFSF